MKKVLFMLTFVLFGSLAINAQCTKGATAGAKKACCKKGTKSCSKTKASCSKSATAVGSAVEMKACCKAAIAKGEKACCANPVKASTCSKRDKKCCSKGAKKSCDKGAKKSCSKGAKKSCHKTAAAAVAAPSKGITVDKSAVKSEMEAKTEMHACCKKAKAEGKKECCGKSLK